MTLRHCNACREWHDLADPWPEACSGHHKIARREPIDAEKRSTIFDNVSVTRGHWREDRVTKEMIPVDEWQKKYGAVQTHTIIKDIDPYKNVYGEVIGGRKQHRDFLRGRNVVEVGNEKITKQYEEPPGLKDDLKRAIHEHGGVRL
jgi:hypothetical protein